MTTNVVNRRIIYTQALAVPPATTAVYANSTLSGDNTTPASVSWRIGVAVGFASQNQVRVTLKAGAGAALGVSGIVCDHVAIGVISSGTATTATPVELKFGGLSGCKIDTANAAVTSDWAALSFLSTDTLCVILDQGSAEGFDASQNGTATVGAFGNNYLSNPGASYNQSAPAGFSNLGAFGIAVASIETKA
jgi:hypothetical protein